MYRLYLEIQGDADAAKQGETWELVSNRSVIRPDNLAQMDRLELRILGVHLEEVMRVVQTALDTSYGYKVVEATSEDIYRTISGVE